MDTVPLIDQGDFLGEVEVLVVEVAHMFLLVEPRNREPQK